MNENEKMVYSSMGFDPILILDEPPLYKNYTVNIILPGVEDVGGEEKNKIPEDNQQQKIDNSNAKNNKDIIRLKNKNSLEQISNTSEKKENPQEKEINVDLDIETNELISADNISIDEKNELSSNESQEVNEDPRRKRRRSSASS